MGRLRSLLLDNLSLKVLAVLLALLLHLVVRRDTVRELSLRVAVGVTGVPEGRVFVGELPDQVEVQVRGRWSSLRELLVDPSRRVACDLSAYRDGERFVFDLRRVGAQLGAGELEVLAVRPSAFEVRLERLATRRVPVQVSTTGDPAPGFGIGPESLTVSPETIEVRGPASEVRRVRQIRAAPIDLTGADADLRVRTRLLPVGGTGVRLGAEEVDVNVRLEEHEITRTLDARPIAVRGCPEGIRCLLEPATAQITVQGKTRVVNALLAAPPDNLVYADVGPAIARKERSVRLTAHALKDLSVRVRPAVANFRLLGEIPAE
ncbi:MAG: hypothetical protein RIT45_113 [Pseudomonadota bacterium]